MANHEVISAFLDDGPFDPQALSDALADPDGRALLIDLVTLRRLTQPDDGELAPVMKRRVPRLVRLALAAAVLAVAVLGGYQWGGRADGRQPDPPMPTRVVSAGAAWEYVPTGSGR